VPLTTPNWLCCSLLLSCHRKTKNSFSSSVWQRDCARRKSFGTTAHAHSLAHACVCACACVRAQMHASMPKGVYARVFMVALGRRTASALFVYMLCPQLSQQDNHTQGDKMLFNHQMQRWVIPRHKKAPAFSDTAGTDYRCVTVRVCARMSACDCLSVRVHSCFSPSQE